MKRSLDAIACDIVRDMNRIGANRDEPQDWFGVFPTAAPYLGAMLELKSVGDYYGHDSGRSIILYFLANAAHWRGETARRLKEELRGLL